MPTTETFATLTAANIPKKDRDAVRTLFDGLVCEAELRINEEDKGDRVEISLWAEDAVLWGGSDTDNPGPITEFLEKLRKYIEPDKGVLYQELSVTTGMNDADPSSPPFRASYFAWMLTSKTLASWDASDALMEAFVNQHMKEADHERS